MVAKLINENRDNCVRLTINTIVKSWKGEL